MDDFDPSMMLDPRMRALMQAQALRGGPMPQGPQMGAPQPMPQQQPPGADFSSRSQELQGQANELMAAPIDASGYQQLAKQKADEGRNALVLSMAARRAGPQFEDVGAQYFKKALGANEPTAVGKAGLVTSEGQFVQDPTFQREQRVKLLTEQAQKYDALAQRSQDMAQRAQMAQAAADARQQAQQEAMALRREMGGIAAQGRADSLAVRQQSQQGQADQRNARMEDTLAHQFDTQTKDIVTQMDAATNMKQLLRSGRPLTMQDQSALIYQLNKMFDPGSVVREGEYDRIFKQQGIPDRVQSVIARLSGKGMLGPNTLKEIDGLVSFYEGVAQDKLAKTAAPIEQTARARNLDVSNVIRNRYYSPQGGGAAAAPATSTAGWTIVPNGVP